MGYLLCGFMQGQDGSGRLFDCDLVDASVVVAVEADRAVSFLFVDGEWDLVWGFFFGCCYLFVEAV